MWGKPSMNNDVAIYLDLDNLVIGAKKINFPFDINLILEHIKKVTNGRIVLRQAYGAGRQSKHLLQELAEAGFIVQSATKTSNYSKNLADMQIVVNAMDTIVDGHQYNTYVLISGDSDFTPLVQSLRKRGRRVIGLGIKHTTSSSLEELCDQYIYYEDIFQSTELDQEGLERLLLQARDDLLLKKKRVQASVLNQHMMDISRGGFNSSAYPEGNFRKFLEQYPGIIRLIQEGSTTYVAHPLKEETDRPLHLRYRSALKKKRLRVIPAKYRFIILKDMIQVLHNEEDLLWRDVLNKLAECYNLEQRNISKNIINAVMLVARQGRVIHTLKGRSLSSAPVRLEIEEGKLYQKAIVMCDTAYLEAIHKLTLPFDLTETALALYDDQRFAPYLRRIAASSQLI